LLGWIGKEIADVVSVDPKTITNVMENMKNFKNSILQDFSKGKPIEEFQRKYF